MLSGSQHWFRLWLGAVRQQAITWVNVDPYVHHHMVPLGQNELTNYMLNCFEETSKYITVTVWHHNEFDGVSNHWCIHCLLNHLFWCRSKKTSKLRVTGLCGGNSQVTIEFPIPKPSNAENVSICWHHHDIHIYKSFLSTELVQVAKIQRSFYPIQIVPWLLMTWWCKGPGHWQSWCWPGSPVSGPKCWTLNIYGKWIGHHNAPRCPSNWHFCHQRTQSWLQNQT